LPVVVFAVQGDINSDGFINWKDMEVFADLWLSGSGSADLNGDSEVDIADLALLAQHWLDIVNWDFPYNIAYSCSATPLSLIFNRISNLS